MDTLSEYKSGMTQGKCRVTKESREKAEKEKQEGRQTQGKKEPPVRAETGR